MTKKKLQKVTAVITTFKRPINILERAVKSVVKQSYSNIELIIVDDDPTVFNDNRIKKMIAKYNEHILIKYIKVKKNGGANKARNIALNSTNSEFIGFLDDDDEWMPSKIERQVSIFETKDDEHVIVYCNNYNYYVESNNEVIEKRSTCPSGNIYEELLKGNIIGSFSFPLFRTNILKAIGGFRNDMEALQDWEVYFRIMAKRKYKAIYLNEPLARYYFYKGERISVHPERRTRSFEKIKDSIDKNEVNVKKKNLARFYLMGTYFYSVAGDNKIAWKYYIKGVLLWPFSIILNIKDFFRMILRPLYKNKQIL